MNYIPQFRHFMYRNRIMLITNSTSNKLHDFVLAPRRDNNRIFRRKMFHDMICFIPSVFHYPHRVLNSCRFSVLFARFPTRGPSDNMIGFLPSRSSFYLFVIAGRLYYWLATVNYESSQFLAV